MGIGGAERGEAFLRAEPLLIGKAEVEFRIEAQPRHQILRTDKFPGGRLESFPQFFETGFLKTEARSHIVAAEGIQQSRASPERLDVRKPLDAAAASLACSVPVKADDQGRPVPAPRDTRGDDADHPLMPVAHSRHDRGMAFGVEMRPDPLLGLERDITLDGLAFTVLVVEMRGDPSGLLRVIREQEGECLGGASKAARGVDPGTDLEADVGGIVG